MKFTPVLLLCAAFLIAALPIRADSLSYTGTANDSTNTENSAPQFRASTTKMLSPATARVISAPLLAIPVQSHEIAYLALPADSSNMALAATTFGTSDRRLDSSPIDGRLSDPTPAIASIGGFEPSGSFAAWGSEPSFISAALFPPSSDVSAHSSSPSELGSGHPALLRFESEDTRHKIGRERGEPSDGKDPDKAGAPSVLVPEPEALPLLLFGLAAVGSLARRRNVFPTAA
jgi:hypothetical protein